MGLRPVLHISSAEIDFHRQTQFSPRQGKLENGKERQLSHSAAPFRSLLPGYHDNSFFSCRALHISNSLNKSSTYPLLELFFDRQEELYNVPTRAMSRENIIKLIVELIAEVTSDKLAIENGFKDVETDLAARTSFKYGCSRGVIGTPFFLVNGFALPGAGSALDYEQWQSIISPLLVKSSEEEEKASFALF
ncbi:thioredoxin superfamily protein isoform X2 [Wolffia australiana]